jgi:hypothetical protein
MKDADSLPTVNFGEAELEASFKFYLPRED